MKLINGIGLAGILFGLAMLLPILSGPTAHEKVAFAEWAALAGIVIIVVSLLCWFTVGLLFKIHGELKNE